MKTFRSALSGSAACGLAGLIWGSLLGSLVCAVLFTVIDGWPQEEAFLTLLGSVLSAYLLALGLGMFLVPLIGIPAYALLKARGRDSYVTAGLVGLIPAGVMLIAFDNQAAVAGIFAVFGLCVGFLTHFFASQAQQQGHAL